MAAKKTDIETYLEIISRKIRLPYILFAILMTSCGLVFTWLFSPSYRDLLLSEYLMRRLIIFSYISGFLMMIMTRNLKNASMKTLLELDLPFPDEIKSNMFKYLFLIFSPYNYKSLTETSIRWKPIFSNYLLISFTLSILLGTFMFVSNISDETFGFLFNIIQNGIGAACGWFIFFVLAFFVINLLHLLKFLRDTKPVVNSYIQVLELRKLWVIPINILYSFASVLIILPPVVRSVYNPVGAELYTGKILFFLEMILFIILFFIPGLLVNDIIKNARDDYYTLRKHALIQLEEKINDSDATTEEWLRYHALLYNLYFVEKLETWPRPPEIVKLILTAILSTAPMLLNIIRSLI